MKPNTPNPALGGPSLQHEFRLGEWVVQPQLNLITSLNGTVHLEPKMMELLVYLAQHRGEVVSKDQLIQRVWANAYVEDAVLTSAIWKLRQALGDDAQNPLYIQSIPKRGYRLIADTGNDERDPRTLDSESQDQPTSRGKGLAGILALALLLILTITLKPWNLFTGRPGFLGTLGAVPSVTLLYFDNLTGDLQGEVWAAGLTEAVIMELAKLRTLSVKSRLQVLPFKGNTPDLATLREVLGVDVFLESSLQKVGEDLESQLSSSMRAQAITSGPRDTTGTPRISSGYRTKSLGKSP